MKTNFFFLIIIVASLINFGCNPKCDKAINKLSQHVSFNYFAFDGGSWYLSDNDSSLTINSFFGGEHGRMYRTTKKRCEEVVIITGYTCSYSDSMNLENDFSFKVYNDYRYNKWINSVNLYVSQRNISYSKELPFDITNTSMNNDDIQLYFKPSLTIKGVTYNDVAVQFFNSNDTTTYVEKLFVAPYVGPVRIDLSDGRVFELDSSTVSLANADFFN